MNEIYLRRATKVILDKGENQISDIVIATMAKNIENLGYTFSLELFKTLKTLSMPNLVRFNADLVANLKKMVGAHVQYRPMYPNFPVQVMEASEFELFFNAIIHYATFGKLMPNYEKKERFPLYEQCKIKIINLGSEEDFNKIFTNLMSSKTSISETDKADLEWFSDTFINQTFVEILPQVIPLKENVALVAKLLLKNNIDTSGNLQGILQKYFKTATDILRLAVALSDGDISLAENTKFKSFKRSERRLLLGLLENCNNIEENMLKYKGQWIRLGERLHPSEFKKYNNAKLAFEKLRNNVKIETFNGKVETLMSSKNYSEVAQLLKQRPGEFARRLDSMLRVCSNTNVILNEFKDITGTISTPVLLQVIAHFKNRNTSRVRSFFPKGNIAKVKVIDNTLPLIDTTICNNVVKICENALINNFKQKEFLGNVYLDEKLRDYLVPFSQRSASKSLKTYVRGSKISLPENITTVRSFVYWKEPKDDRTDLDISAILYDADWNYVEHISYTNLRSAKYKCCHSGDIVTAPNGATEYIDIDINSMAAYGARYVVMSVNSFTGQPFNTLPECFMGWMSRECPNSGEIYEPKTVQDKADITADTKICIPIVIDVIDRKVIWADLALKKAPSYNCIENNKENMTLMGRAITSLVKPTLYDLFSLHVIARGNFCDDRSKADVIFSLDEGITPYDYEKIIGEFL